MARLRSGFGGGPKMSGRRSEHVTSFAVAASIWRQNRGGTGRNPFTHCDTVGGFTPSTAAMAFVPPMILCAFWMPS